MSQKDFAAGVTRAFGKPALSGAVALAHQGTETFDALSMAVGQTGAAASITASRGQGLCRTFSGHEVRLPPGVGSRSLSGGRPGPARLAGPAGKRPWVR
jgi:hypothetical protein